MSKELWIYHSDKITLQQWCKERDCCEAEVIEYLISNYLEDLEDVFPKVDDPENDRNIKSDLKYERLVDERMGF